MTVKKTEAKSAPIIKVNDLKIQRGVLYKIENKLDRTAPDGLQELGTTKLPRPDAANGAICKYDPESNLYDTGFYINSACYRGMDLDDKKELVKFLKREVVDPYEEMMNKKGLLEATNYDFWDNFIVTLYEGKVFNTDSEKDLLELYIAMRSAYLTPAHLTGDPRFNGSDFVIKDSIETVSLKQKRINTEQEAVYHFRFLLDSDETKIAYILKSLDIIRLHIKPTKDDMSSAFALWLEKDLQNAEYFEKVYNKSKTDEGYEEIVLKAKVKEAIHKGKIKKEVNEYFLGEVPLGIDVNSIIINLTTKDELAETRDAIRIMK